MVAGEDGRRSTDEPLDMRCGRTKSCEDRGGEEGEE